MTAAKRVADAAVEAAAEFVPGGLGAELKEALRAALESACERLGLVTREELEVQEAVLRRTREKLHRLEQRVAELEEDLLRKAR